MDLARDASTSTSATTISLIWEGISSIRALLEVIEDVDEDGAFLPADLNDFQSQLAITEAELENQSSQAAQWFSSTNPNALLVNSLKAVLGLENLFQEIVRSTSELEEAQKHLTISWRSEELPLLRQRILTYTSALKLHTKISLVRDRAGGLSQTPEDWNVETGSQGQYSPGTTNKSFLNNVSWNKLSVNEDLYSAHDSRIAQALICGPLGRLLDEPGGDAFG
ncbi:hypothetical protein BT63DRAFT_49914 [Microthyrium microscopicum]|uniref:Uncharacterized protein n=1 Tax=Microthyrium microscopicum TaxID=703497 RepID=A0A6A6U1E7_9PEZI|nr:hypothetical protein BT63DRAFT_49914 [Microthyrium microscopicum]